MEKVTILGVGLIGASFALAMKKNRLCGHVVGYGRTEANLIKAKERAVIDSYELNPRKACENADLIVFATPVGRIVPLAKEVKGSLKAGALVIDVGSVKGKLVYEMESLMPEGVCFVGCHPIAGSELSGIDASGPAMFKGTVCIITRTEKTEEAALGRVSGIWSAFGSTVKAMSPEEHDRIYGLLSHIPHLVAYALVNTAADMEAGCLEFAGRGFMDTTRIALSSPEIWRDICLMNKENLLEFIEVFKDNIDRLALALRSGDSEGLEEAFKRAQTLRKKAEERH